MTSTKQPTNNSNYLEQWQSQKVHRGSVTMTVFFKDIYPQMYM